MPNGRGRDGLRRQRPRPDRGRAGPDQARRPRRRPGDAPTARRGGRGLGPEAGGEDRPPRLGRDSSRLIESAGPSARCGRPRRRQHDPRPGGPLPRHPGSRGGPRDDRASRQADRYGRRSPKPATRALADDDEESELVCGTIVGLIDQYIALGDMARARALIRRLVDDIGPPQGPVKAAFLGAFGGYLDQGRRPRRRPCPDRAVASGRARASRPEARAFALPMLAKSLVEAGELDQALALAPGDGCRRPSRRSSADLMGSRASDPTAGWPSTSSGIIINIGIPVAAPQGPGPRPRRPAEDRRRRAGARATPRCRPASWRASPTSRAAPATSPAPWRRPGRSPN